MSYSESRVVKSAIGLLDAVCAKIVVIWNPGAPAGSATSSFYVEYWQQSNYAGTVKDTKAVPIGCTATIAGGAYSGSFFGPGDPFVIDPAILAGFKISVSQVRTTGADFHQIDVTMSIDGLISPRDTVKAKCRVQAVVGP